MCTLPTALAVSPRVAQRLSPPQGTKADIGEASARILGKHRAGSFLWGRSKGATMK